MDRDGHTTRPSASADKRAELARLLREKARRGSTIHPLSVGQQSLWFLHRSDPESPAYNTAFAARVRSAIDVERLRESLSSLVGRHAALRTSFPERDGQPVQQIHGERDLNFQQVDVSSSSWPELSERVHADYRRPFDLQNGPLTRAALYTRHDDDHVFLWTFHHIICDAWSMWMLMDELMQLYSAVDRPAELAARPGQFHEYVLWQNKMAAGAQGDRLWQYWREKLGGELPVLGMPTDRPRPRMQKLRGASHTFEIDEALASKVTEVGKLEGATPYMTLLAALQVLLHRYSNQEDIIVGSPVAGRNHADFARTVGYFANPLPVRSDLSGDPPFTDFLGQVRQTVLDGLAHQDLPFPELVRRLQPDRDPSRGPLFQVMFVMQRPPRSEAFQELFSGQSAGGVEWGGLTLEAFDLLQMEGQFDLTWEVVEGEESFSCVLKYNTAIFDAATIARMEVHLRTLLESIAEDPGQSISRLAILDASESNQVLTEWNATARDYRLDRCLHHWIEEQVERTGDEIAVSFDDQTLSWQELNRRSNQLARHLRKMGVGRDVPVGVCVERSLEMVVGLLGILKAGGAYLPVDPSEPRERLEFMLNDAQAPLILTQERFADRLRESAARVVRLDADWPAIGQQTDGNLDTDIGPEDLAYIIYTSGSTGQPKGAANSHRGICNRLLWMQEQYQLDSSDRVLQKTPYTFDVSVWEFFWPLMVGARLVVARPGGHKEGDYLADVIADCRITTVHFVPSMLRAFLNTADVERVNGALRRVICSGEALARDLQEQFFDRIDSELHNLYGPTEAAIDVTYWQCRRGDKLTTVPIGKPIANTQIYILDRHLQPTPIGVPGELHIGGAGLARGYWNRPELTAEKFIDNPFDDAARDPSRRTRLYKTGDLCRWLPAGDIEYLERIDHQVKIRGFRIELGEIETALTTHPQICEAVARADRDSTGTARLLAWVVPQDEMPARAELRNHLKQLLPEYMIPAVFTPLESVPLTTSGKVNYRALPAPNSRAGAATPAHPFTEVEREIAEIWRDTLQLDEVGVNDNFFDVGGHSLLLAQIQSRLTETFGRAPAMVEMFQYPTVALMAGYFGHPGSPPQRDLGTSPLQGEQTSSPEPGVRAPIAIVGMSCRFPGAADVDTFWQNLVDGVETISHFTDEQLLARGVERELVQDPNYVGAHGDIDGKELFDAAFFGFSPREAEMLDVQHRQLLESAWTALEHAGQDPQASSQRCGVFAGVGPNSYLLNNVLPHRDLMATVGGYQALLAHDKDFAATRLSYKLDLTGPSMTVQTACSTSLVAVHQACQSLLAGECELALAGGCSISVPGAGYLYQPEMILSPDGHCRAFDKDAQGTVGGSGVGFVVLKRLSDAVRQGDTIYAVIRGSAINNDGGVKAGYTAPSIDGQSAVIAKALQSAGVEPDSIGYIEAHGTGTTLGDPIEIAALSRVLGERQADTPGCKIGSVKTNVGHLDTAAGVAGLIKAALSLHHGVLPPSLHFNEPNPKMDLDGGWLQVNDERQPWKRGDSPRRAGVSSFGIGGTNAHVVLEESPPIQAGEKGRPRQLITLSARSEKALDAATDELAEHLRKNPTEDLADVAFTLACGRRHFEHRRVLVCRSSEEAAHALHHEASQVRSAAGGPLPKVITSAVHAEGAAVALMFSGQGAQYVGMASDLYQEELVFREHIDRCCELLRPHLPFDLREVLYPSESQAASAAEQMLQTSVAQPALFAVEYALSQLWAAWGVHPQAMIGHSLGEYVAACLSGVMSLEDALRLVAQRGRIMQEMPAGSMLAVSLPEDEVHPLLGDGLSLAAVNGSHLCVVSGLHASVRRLANRLELDGVACRQLRTSHAFHSAMMDPAVEAFRAAVTNVELREPTIPFVSNVTGNWIEPGQATDADYWARHLRQPVRFHAALQTLLEEPRRLLIEAGPGNVLASLAMRHPQRAATQTVVTSTRHATEKTSDAAHLLKAVGKVWAAGAHLDWSGFFAGQQRRRRALPTYPFQRERYWIDAPEAGATPEAASSGNMDDWTFIPSWQRSVPPVSELAASSPWLVFIDSLGWGEVLARRLEERGASVTRVRQAGCYLRQSEAEYAINPLQRGDYDLLFRDLHEAGRMPRRVMHLWNCRTSATPPNEHESFFGLIYLAQALGEQDLDEPCRIVVVSNNLHSVTGAERLDPAKALLLGPATVIPQEYAHLHCRTVDLDLQPNEPLGAMLVERLLAEPEAPSAEAVVAYRNSHRWVRQFAPARLEPQDPQLRDRGVYLITGGTGGLGLELAEWFARNAKSPRLVLTARSEVPARSEWPRHLDASGTSMGEDSQLRDRIERLALLEELGAEVLVMAADVSDSEQMRTVVERAVATLGGIDGVVHAAGVPGGGTIQLKTREDAESEFAARVEGSLVLDRLLSDQTLDFFVLCSSIVSTTGGLGQVAYCAACSFLDAFADDKNARQDTDTRFISINWDRWQGSGMAVVIESLHRELTGEELTGGMQPAEACEVFSRILASGFAPRVVVSSQDFGRLVERSQTYQLGHIDRSPQLELHTRPELATDYVAPANEIEERVARIWQQELGIEQVGTKDDFVSLGGDSLLAIKLVARLREEFEVQLNVRALYDQPTVAALAEHVAAVHWAAEGDASIGTHEQEEEGVL